MKVTIIERKTKETAEGRISRVKKKELPLKKAGWNFNWRELYKVEGAEFYKLTLNESQNRVEGILMLSIQYEEMVIMNNIELAPYNIGVKKKYRNVAGCLLAFACKYSFEKGKGSYEGFLSFDSKTELIELYQNKYGAQWAMGHKMYFDPIAGKALMKKYLKIDKKLKK